MPEPDANGSERYGCEEVSRELVVTGCDSSEMFDFVEEALDEIAQPVEVGIDRPLMFAVALGGNVRLRSMLGDHMKDCCGVVPFVGDDISRQRHAIDQRRERRLVGGLAGGEQEPDRQAVSIDDGVDLCAQSSTRTTDGVIRAPLFPPAACWWARTIEESMR